MDGRVSGLMGSEFKGGETWAEGICCPGHAVGIRGGKHDWAPEPHLRDPI
jgi:hypothetical protein